MAGLGRKVFTRERATVADVQGYLMDQTVMVFPSASGRTTAVSASDASEGMVSYLKDVDQIDVHNGSTWDRLANFIRRRGQLVTFFATTISDASEVGIATISFTGPPWPYRIIVSGVVNVAATAGVASAVRARLDSVGGPQLTLDTTRSGQFPAGETMPLPLEPIDAGVLTGNHTLIVTCRRTFGSGNWAVAAGGNSVRFELVPA